MKTSPEESSAFYATCWGSEDSAGSDKGEIEGVGWGWGEGGGGGRGMERGVQRKLAEK